MLGDGWASAGADVSESERMRHLSCCMLHAYRSSRSRSCRMLLSLAAKIRYVVAACTTAAATVRVRARQALVAAAVGAGGLARHGGTWWFSSTLVSLYVIASALIVRTCDRRHCGFAPKCTLTPPALRAYTCVHQVCVRACVRTGECVCVRECVCACASVCANSTGATSNELFTPGWSMSWHRAATAIAVPQHNRNNARQAGTT